MFSQPLSPSYKTVNQSVGIQRPYVDPFEGEPCQENWKNKFILASSPVLKQDSDSLFIAIKNLKLIGLRRRHLFSKKIDTRFHKNTMFDVLLPAHTVRGHSETIDNRALYQLIYLDKMLQNNTDLSSRLRNAMSHRLMTFDLLLKIYSDIVTQTIPSKPLSDLDDQDQNLVKKEFLSWLDAWEKFCSKQPLENLNKLKTFVECGIPHSVQDKLAHAHQQRQEEAKAEQARREREAENVKQVLKLQALEKPQYSNPYVEAIFRGISTDRHRKFFLFDEASENSKPNGIHIGVTTNGDSVKTATEIKTVLSSQLFRSLGIKTLEIYWQDTLDQNNPAAINELFRVADALSDLRFICIYSDGPEDYIIRNHQISALIQVLTNNPNIKRLSFRSVRIEDDGYKQLLKYWKSHPSIEIDIDETNELNDYYKRNPKERLVSAKQLLEKKSSMGLTEPPDNGKLVTFDDIAPLSCIVEENPHKPVSVSSMIKDNRLILRAPTEPVVKANTPAPMPESSIFNTDKLTESFEHYTLNNSELDANSLNLTLNEEQKPILANLIAALGKERVQFFIQYDKIYGLIDFLQTGRFSIAEITVLDKQSIDHPLSRLAMLLAPHKSPLANGATLSDEEIDTIVAYETNGLSPSERFKDSVLDDEERQTIGHLQRYYDKVIVPAVKERIRLTQDWKTIENLPPTEETQKEYHLLEQKMGLFTDFIHKSGQKLHALSSAVETSIEENKPIAFRRHCNQQHLTVDHSYREAMNGTAGFETVREDQKDVLNAARHPVSLKVQQFFAAIATIPAVIFGVLTAFQLYSPRDIGNMFLTKSEATLFTAQSDAKDIENTLLQERTLAVSVH